MSSLDELPRDLRNQLIRLSILAFEGVKQNKVVFTKEDLVRQNLPHDISGLGLLQIVDSFVATGGGRQHIAILFTSHYESYWQLTSSHS